MTKEDLNAEPDYPLVHEWIEYEVEAFLSCHLHSLGGTLIEMLESNLRRFQEAHQAELATLKENLEWHKKHISPWKSEEEFERLEKELAALKDENERLKELFLGYQTRQAPAAPRDELIENIARRIVVKAFGGNYESDAVHTSKSIICGLIIEALKRAGSGGL